MSDDVAELLAEIRDQQREQLAMSREALELAREQRRVDTEMSERSLRNQEPSIAAQARAIDTAQRSARLYRVVVSIAGVLVVVLVDFAIRLLQPYS